MSGLLLAAFVLVAMGWFAIGWVARGHENRRYAESRLRSLAAEAALDTHVPVESERLPASPASAPAIHIHLSAGSPAWAPVATRVIDTPALESRD